MSDVYLCRMQWQEEVKTHWHKVAYLDPARIHQTEHSFKLTEKGTRTTKSCEDQEGKR